MPKNFFKFDLSHPVVRQYCEHHNVSTEVFQEGNDVLQEFDDVESVEDGIEGTSAIEYYQKTFDVYVRMQQAYIDLFISYYAFKQAAANDELVMVEFKKIPADFDFLKNHLETSLTGFDAYLKMVRLLL